MSTAAERDELRQDLSQMRYATQDWVKKANRPADRGDPSSADFTLGSFTTDGNWHTLNLSSIAPAGVKWVIVNGYVLDDAADSWFNMRKNGNSNADNVFQVRTQVANIAMRYNNVWMPCDSGRLLEYQAKSTTFTQIALTVGGWM